MYDTTIDFETVDGYTVASIANEVDISNAETVRRYLDEAAGQNATFIVSLAKCTYIDSSGLQPIIALAKRLGTGFHVVVPPGTQIRRIFDLTALFQQMDVCTSLDEAVAHASKGLTAA